MRSKSSFLFRFLKAIIVLTVLVHSKSSVAVPPGQNLQPLELISGTSIESEPDAMAFRCQGYRCNTYSELIYWGIDNKIYFLDGNSLAPTGSSLNASFNSLPGGRYLFYDRDNEQIYVLLKTSEGYYPDAWERLDVGIIRDYSYAESVPVNKDFNTPDPVDKYYPIDGAAMQNSGANVKIYVDNPVNGTVDILTFDAHNPAISSQSTRFSYRSPLACSTQQYCNWHSNSGSSLAVDKFGSVYIADNNDFIDRILVYNSDGSAKPPFNNIGSLFPCFVDEAGLSMAPQENLLYLPNGCQSFEDGAVAQLDITGNNNHKIIKLLYHDQGMIVDWSDQKRAFIATTDYYDVPYEYDAENKLYIHLLYDGQVIYSLPVMSNYKKRSLTAMAFDAHAEVLYLAVEKSIYKVKVNYPSPQLPEWNPIVGPTFILLNPQQH